MVNTVMISASRWQEVDEWVRRLTGRWIYRSLEGGTGCLYGIKDEGRSGIEMCRRVVSYCRVGRVANLAPYVMP